ncbi:MAG: hypothetical protein NE334_08405 [Lentisphaeraceae bacterium]|nr:hypothetical protein [Lentisphaeraceae bacterium]
MATIVKHIETGKNLILIGCGFGAFKAGYSNSSGFLLTTTKTDSGELPMLALAFPNGEIHWCESKDVEVISIDGQSPKDILS